MTLPALVDNSKICLPPLHNKLSLVKMFVEEVDKENEGLAYLGQEFPKINDAKIKE